MRKRTTIELDEDLLERAKRSLGCRTTRATVEEALRRAAITEEALQRDRAQSQRDYLARLSELTDPEVLAGEEMWR